MWAKVSSMVGPPFVLVESQGEESPLVVEIPHAGLVVPPAVLACIEPPARAIARDADLYVDDLFADAPAEGATLLVANISRYVIDLNRLESDLDAAAVEGGRGRLAHGLVWRVTTAGEELTRRPISRAELEQRLTTIYRPYHQALRAALDRKRQLFGHAVLLAAHSMPSLRRGQLRADVVPGTRGRTTAASSLIDAVDRHARDARLSVAHDDPYKGGFTTQHYGKPAEGVHALQIELARRLYMNEETLVPGDGFAPLRGWCRTLARLLGKTAPR